MFQTGMVTSSTNLGLGVLAKSGCRHHPGPCSPAPASRGQSNGDPQPKCLVMTSVRPRPHNPLTQKRIVESSTRGDIMAVQGRALAAPESTARRRRAPACKFSNKDARHCQANTSKSRHDEF